MPRKRKRYEAGDWFEKTLRELIANSEWSSRNKFIKEFNKRNPTDVTITPGQLSEYIGGRSHRMPYASVLVKLADFFDVSVDYLLGRPSREAALDQVRMETKMVTCMTKKVVEEMPELMSNLSYIRHYLAMMEDFFK